MTNPGGDHYSTCTHYWDGVELVEEAEKAVIYFDSKRHLYHVSVRDEHWFSCLVLPEKEYKSLTPLQLMQRVQGQVNFLRTLR